MSNTKNIVTAGGLKAQIDTETLEFKATQDHRPFVEQARQDRENQRSMKDIGYKKACTIPDIVAIEINFKYGLNIHDPMFMHDSDAVKKLMKIVRSEYPYLLSY